jgi:raffinose/stachyose/melibiose transport system substrate-binding protein
MKKFIMFLLLAVLVFAPALSASAVTLTIETWRPDDTNQWNQILDFYMAQNPGVTLTYEGITSKEYNATLRTQLETGKGPDIIMARSYENGRKLYEDGYLGDCSAIPGVKENFAESSLSPWRMPDGTMFAVPTAAVQQIVFYNKTLFEANGYAIPETWEDFLSLCQVIRDADDNADFSPLANGVADEWDLLECVFLGMLPNYVGGAAEREKYESGEKQLNDEAFVAAYTDFAKLTPFLPANYTAVGNSDAQILFVLERAAMWIDGSWSAGSIATMEPEFEWGVFAIPAPAGKATAICFHPDFAMTFNKASENIDAAKDFLAWMITEEGARVIANLLPAGFYPMVNFPIALDDPHANESLQLNQGKETDARFIWPEMQSIYEPMNKELIAILAGAQTPQGAADAMAAAFAN